MIQSYLQPYLQSHTVDSISPAAVAFLAGLDALRQASPGVAAAIVAELNSQRTNLKLIASENISSLAVQIAQGNLFTDKYAEGFLRSDPSDSKKWKSERFYSGCDNVDAIEREAAELAKALFGADHAFVQPHSGADANLLAFLAILHRFAANSPTIRASLDDISAKKFSEFCRSASTTQWKEIRGLFHGQKLLALDFDSGGHLTHGYRLNFSAQLFDCYSYRVDPKTGLIDLDEVRRIAKEVRPLILLAGYSAYPRMLDFARLREIADEVGAVLMVDMAHFAGLVAAKVFAGPYNPIPFAHVVTSTTHKTLRGPRGGLVLCNKEFAQYVDRACPMMMGGPLPHVMAAKAVAFREAMTPAFREYGARIVENSRAFAEACLSESIPVLTGGTDNHLVLVNVFARFGLNGRQAEGALRSCGVTLNRNALPIGADGIDPRGPWFSSGLRIGTPAVTTLGMGPEQMREIALLIREVLSSAVPGDKAAYQLESKLQTAVRERVREMLTRFPVYPEIPTLLA